MRKQYHWKFTKEVAEEFIPRLEKKGFLVKHKSGPDAFYVVEFPTPPDIPDTDDIRATFEKIIDEFEKFSPRVTDLFSYEKSRDELADILIRFLVSSNVMGQNGVFNPAANEEGLLAQLEEGGRKLEEIDEYIAARFVRHITDKQRDFVPHLARLAAIGLLTEVVDDFVRPTTPPDKVDLTIVLDAPLALDYLGLSGTAIQQDSRTVFDALREIGCKLVVFPITCDEMSRNLNSMLAKQAGQRFGPTHQAMLKKEVMLEFVKAVAQKPEDALERGCPALC